MANTDIFEKMASGYDTPERVQIAKVIADEIRNYITEPNKKAVDFGCGTGLVGLSLLDEFQSVLFLDTSKNMLQQIEHKTAEYDIQNVETLCFDIEQEPLVDLDADYIFMSQVLLHIPNTELVLSRLSEALNPDGHLIIVDFDKNEAVSSERVHNGFEQEELARFLRQIGFKNVQSKTFYQAEKVFMGKDASLFILDAQK